LAGLVAALAILQAAPDDAPLSVSQAAELMNISERKVYNLCEQGLLRHTKSPIRILPADIDAYQTKQQSGGPVLRHLR
jgi:excisionase family DNA binding protein